MGQYLKKKKTKGKLQRSLLILGEMRTNPSMEPGLGEKTWKRIGNRLRTCWLQQY